MLDCEEADAVPIGGRKKDGAPEAPHSRARFFTGSIEGVAGLQALTPPGGGACGGIRGREGEREGSLSPLLELLADDVSEDARAGRGQQLYVGVVEAEERVGGAAIRM